MYKICCTNNSFINYYNNMAFISHTSSMYEMSSRESSC